MSKVKIGLVGVNSSTYYAKEYKVYEETIKGLKPLEDKYGFETVPYKELIESGDEAKEVLKFFEKEKIDFLLVQNSSFSMGDVIEVLIDSEINIGLWAVSEPETEQDVKLHSLVSLNMYSSIIKRCFKDRDIKYKWFYGNVDTKMFIDRFEPTILSMKAIKKLKETKICWVGSVAPTFDNIEPDLDELKRKFGVNIEVMPTLEVKKVADHLTEQEIQEARKVFCKDIENICITEDMMERGLIVYAALSKIAKDHKYGAMALSCWPDFQELFGIVPCVPFSEMYDIDQVPVSCEGDLQALITMLVLNEMTDQKSIVMDFANVDLENEMMLLWHCGIGTKSLAACPKDIAVINQPMMNRKLGDEHRMGLSYDFYFKESPVTIARISDNGESVFFFNGNVSNNNSAGFTGTRGWINNLNFLNQELPILDLVNTILLEGIEHHLVIVPGSCGETMSEFTYWTGCEVIKPVAYKDYL